MKVLLLKDPKDKDSGPDPYIKVSKFLKKQANNCVVQQERLIWLFQVKKVLKQNYECMSEIMLRKKVC